MTLSDVHTLLCSRNFYEKGGMKKFRFQGNALSIDRRAQIPFYLFEEEGSFYIDTISVIAVESQLRIEINNTDGSTFHFYGKSSGNKAFVLE